MRRRTKAEIIEFSRVNAAMKRERDLLALPKLLESMTPDEMMAVTRETRKAAREVFEAALIVTARERGERV